MIRYSEKDSNAKGVLLSLVKPGFKLSDSWFRRSYVELIEYYDDLLNKVDETFRLFLIDYIEYMKNVEKIIEKISYSKSYYLEESNNKVL